LFLILKIEERGLYGDSFFVYKGSVPFIQICGSFGQTYVLIVLADHLSMQPHPKIALFFKEKFQNRVGIENFKNFLTNDPLGVILCGESIARIPEP